MDIDLEQSKIEIIKECINANDRFSGNEDLYEKVYEETMKRGFIVF